MLAGTYPMNVDAKARVTLPAVFRKQLTAKDGKAVMLVPMGDSVRGYTPEGFKEFVDGLFEYGDNHFDPRSRKDTALKTGLWASAVEVEIDSAGRIALGKLDASRPGTRERYGLTSDVVVVGSDDHFQVWNAEKWAETQASFEDDFEALLFHD